MERIFITFNIEKHLTFFGEVSNWHLSPLEGILKMPNVPLFYSLIKEDEGKKNIRKQYLEASAGVI